MKLLKSWRMMLLIFALLFALGLIFVNFSGEREGYLENTNIKLGLDFEGGTLLQIELQNEVGVDEINRIANIISQRIDPSGLKDNIITPIGNKFIVIQLSETQTSEIEKIESRIRQQGQFEATINGETIFTGDQILRVLRGDNSYGVYQQGTSFEWRLPFVLNDKAVESFTEKTFHQCTPVSFTTTGQPIYDCAKTIFFLDKPKAIIIISEDQYDFDKEYIFLGDRALNIPIETDLDLVIDDSQLNVIVFDGTLNTELLSEIKSQQKISQVIISQDLENLIKSDLENLDFSVEIIPITTNQPWIWNVINAKQIISLTEGITNQNVATIDQAKRFSTLYISGQRDSFEEAQNDLEELAILLESGSLPTPVKTISRETISASLGESFKSLVFIMAIIAFIVIGLVLAIRYKNWKLIIPIFIIGTSEVIINLGFIVWTGRPLDLAAFVGLITAIGTGVDSEIVITDEIMAKSKKVKESLLKRVKSALFIIMTSAFTMIAVMIPIILFARTFPGIDKLYGFATVAIVGALIGVFITRPAFTIIIEKIVDKIEKE